MLSCSFCGKTQHEVKELIAGPSIFVCDECVVLCNDILDDNEFSRLLEADEECGDRSYPAALAYLRGKSTNQLTRYVEARKNGAERCRLDLQQITRMLAMRDDEVLPETDALATPKFAFLKNMTKEGLLALQRFRLRFDPSLFTREQLTEIERVLRMVAATQAGTGNGR